jgi:glycosyl hydrolase family 9/cellulase-like Ig domain-containing protein
MASPVMAAPPAGGGLRGYVRIDQVGYLPSEVKHAALMTSAPVRGASFAVVDSAGRAVRRGHVSPVNQGRWNAAFPAVYDISFSSLARPGRYHVVVHGPVRATSLPFQIESANAVYGKLVVDGVSFDQVQRDGAHVIPGPLRRQPAHLNDRHATVYAWPHFQPDSDTITDADLKAIGGPVDVSGGWADAGDYLKITHTSAYNDVLLYASARALGRAAPASLIREARFGEQWLTKMWDEKSKTLYIQVGIGSGNEAGTFFGDHDFFRLPQVDDARTAPDERYVAHRPVFAAARPGQPVSPNLAGRLAAAFALAAQADAQHDRSRAWREYRQATSLYAMADTASPPQPLTTALPNAFYPESTWHDDMELGASEIALAAQLIGADAHKYLSDAARWAAAYLAADTGDTFNLYDTSALAHTDLIRAVQRSHGRTQPAVSRRALIADVARQIKQGAQHAAKDPFHAGGNYDDFDVDSHTLGLVATAGWYHQLTGDRRFDAFATRQRNWIFGANPWGTSFMVGEGTVFPRCMQHQVANISGTTNGKPPIDVGAVVNGPNGVEQFADGLGGLQDGMVKCPARGGDVYRQFTGRGARYIDDVRSWQTDEPALDMTGAAIIAAAVQLAVHRTAH